MKSCTFFGHKYYINMPYKYAIKFILVDLIENHGVTRFYNCLRSSFDYLCFDHMLEVKNQFPHVINTMVLSYKPDKDLALPYGFDDYICLTDNSPEPDKAYVVKRIAEIADYVVAAIERPFDEGYLGYRYAQTFNKNIINVLEQY